MDYPVAVVICAAGASSRMDGIKKEFQKLDTGMSVLESSVRAFASISCVQSIVIAIPQDSEADARHALSFGLMSARKPEIHFVTGGNTRRASVYNALRALVPHNPRYVLIHDGARPWVSISLIENIIKAVKKHDAVIPAIPVTETLKECDMPIWDMGQGLGDNISDLNTVFISNHIKRANIGFAQTPQAFEFSQILSAHEKAAAVEDEEFYDDAEIWGKFRGNIAVIPGEEENRKITFPKDLN